MTTAATLKLAKAKLAASGLTLADAEQLGITLHDSLKELSDQFDSLPGLRFEYRNPDGSPLEVKPGWGPFFRVRKLETPHEEKTGFDGQTDPHAKTGKRSGGRPKYDQEAETGTAAYYPSNIDWLEILLDPEQSIVITEGELKACKACKDGVPCIGIGGVNSYRSASLGWIFLPSLEHAVWKKRKVYIVFDSDIKVKKGIADAVNDLAEQLYQRGAVPYCVFLPDVEGLEKTGLDDYLVHKGINSFKQLCRDSNDDLMLTKAAWDWNRKYIHIVQPHCIVDQRTGETIKVDDYIGANQELNYVVRTISSDGSAILTQTSLASQILKWPHHYKLDKLVYEPGQPPLSQLDDQSAFNVWRGWGIEPKKGDVSPWLELLNSLFGGSTLEAKWLLAWFAYPLQHPGRKLKTAVLMIGAHGAGKSMLAEIFDGIYGENYDDPDIESFFSQFNEWAAKRQFVVANEVIVKGDVEYRAHGSALKNYVTRTHVTINEKYGLKYKIQDRCNIYMTANPMDSLPIENGERRYFIFRTKAGRVDEKFRAKWDAWKAAGGRAALFWYLLNEVDTSWFDPDAPAMETESFRQVVDHQTTDSEELAQSLMVNGPTFGPMKLQGDLFTIQRLFGLLDEDQKKFVRTPSMLKKSLLNSGAIRVNGGADSIGRLKFNGILGTYYAIRNIDRWSKATPDEMRAHLKEHGSEMPKAKEKF